MGMSASQARLLSITSRMNDVEFKSQQISNTKIRLADESEQVANDYTKALNKQKFTYTDYSSGSAVKQDLNSTNLANYGFKLVSRKSNPQYRIKGNGTVNSFATKNDALAFINNGNLVMSIGNNAIKETDANGKFTTINPSTLPTLEVANNFNGMKLDSVDFKQIQLKSGYTLEEFYPDVPKTFTASQLYEMIESGQFYLVSDVTTTTADGVSKTETKEISVSSNTQLAIESDTTELAKAEAEYNAKTAKINNKEKLLDNDLKALDTEHSALKTEYESVKSLIGENIDKSFNLFS